ncbi:hypothetical protein ABPG72_019002 [Tetrahymena utriculariae]
MSEILFTQMEIEDSNFYQTNEENKSTQASNNSDNQLGPEFYENQIEKDIQNNNVYQQKLIRLQNKLECKRSKKNQKLFVSIPSLLKQNIGYKDQFTIFGGINVHVGKEIYLESQYQKTSIGDNFRQPIELIFNKINNRYDCLYQSQQKGRVDFDMIIDMCYKKQSQEYKELGDLLSFYQRNVKKVKVLEERVLKIKKDELQQIESEYQQFVAYCKQVINNKGSNEIYRYCIGRLNFAMGDIEIQYSGFSEGYMHLIGINGDIYQQLFLRGKQISLQSKDTPKVSLSQQAILQRIDFDNKSDHLMQYKIKTIDGFEITIKEKLIKIDSPFTAHQVTKIDHICYIIECEVDVDDILNLIQYREKIVAENSFKSYEEYMSSIMQQNLNDVEYSVLSEFFLQRYYPEQYKYTLQEQNEKNNN